MIPDAGNWEFARLYRSSIDKTTLPADRVLKVCRRFLQTSKSIYGILMGYCNSIIGQSIAENRLQS